MKKALLILLFILCCLCLGTASAQAAFEITGQVHPDLPTLAICVSDTGERQTVEFVEERVLRVCVKAQDGSFSQEFTYLSIEDPAFDQAASMAMLRDVNFDGYQDLLLLTAAGARNVFHAMSVWDVEEGRFRPVETACEWLREEKRFADEITQVELCNVELFPEKRMLLSDEQDGYRFRREIFYMWDGSYALDPKYIWDVYDAGEGLIGEAATEMLTRVVHLWDAQYPEEWYYGQDGVAQERREAFHCAALDGGDRVVRQVANVDWVNLRKQDSKASPSLAKLNAGEEVTVLADACGPENGWVRVLYTSDLTLEALEAGAAGLTGYIWHSFLE